MSLRQKRLEMLRKIIFSSKVGNQEELLSMLADNGIVVTQATLSRDLKELQVAKTPDAAGTGCLKTCPPFWRRREYLIVPMRHHTSFPESGA